VGSHAVGAVSFWRLETTLILSEAYGLHFECHEASADTIAGLQTTTHESGRLPHIGLWVAMRRMVLDGVDM
jgi:hypothetical protein